MHPVKGPVADLPRTLAILSRAKTQPEAQGASFRRRATAMTMSETPRESIPMTAPAPAGELLVSVTEAAAK